MKNKNRFIKGSVGDFGDSKGWFIGQFMDKYGRPDLKVEEVEVCWKVLDSSYSDPEHYHKVGTEIQVVVSGWCELEIDSEFVKLERKDFLVVYPYTKLKVLNFEVGTEIVLTKFPSAPDDKFNV